MFKYFYGNQADQYSFVRIPKTMMLNEEFDALSLEAKLLYGLLLDRMGESKKNRWIDEEDRVYVIYPISSIQEDMKVSKKKAIEYLAELETFGLVEKRVRGMGLPNILYIKNFSKIKA